MRVPVPVRGLQSAVLRIELCSCAHDVLGASIVEAYVPLEPLALSEGRAVQQCFGLYKRQLVRANSGRGGTRKPGPGAGSTVNPAVDVGPMLAWLRDQHAGSGATEAEERAQNSVSFKDQQWVEHMPHAAELAESPGGCAPMRVPPDGAVGS